MVTVYGYFFSVLRFYNLNVISPTIKLIINKGISNECAMYNLCNLFYHLQYVKTEVLEKKLTKLLGENVITVVDKNMSLC